MVSPARSIPALLTVVLAAALLAACGEDDSAGGSGGADDGRSAPIVLGSVFSETGAGASFGPQQVDGARLAAQQVNEAGGVAGTEIRIEQIDDAADPRSATAAMRRLARRDGALAVLGPTFSNSAAEADPVANRLGLPVLAVSNTGPGIVGDCPYPCELVFRDSLGEQAAIPANVENLESTSDIKRAAVIHPLDDPFGEATARIAARALRKSGIELTGVEVFAPGEAGPQPAIDAAMADRAQAIFVTASSGEVAVSVIELARSLGFEGEILGGNAFNSTVAAEAAGEAGKGARSAAAWYAGNDAEANTSFIASYREEYGTEPDQFAAQAFTGVLLLAEAAEAADLSGDLAADRKALAEALAAVELETPLGEFSFTADHDVIQPIWIVAMDGEGGYELLEEVPAG